MLVTTWWLWAALFYVIGTLFAIDALWHGRTAQSTIAWVLGLIFLPFVTLPLYALFGSRRFHGYLRSRRHGHDNLDEVIQRTLHYLTPWKQDADDLTQPFIPLFDIPAIAGNRCKLLTTGEDFYQDMFASIEAAQHSVCIQFYIIRSDASGNKLADLLIEKVAQGVKCYVIYDEVGSSNIKSSYIKRLKKSGVFFTKFNSTRLLQTRLQYNFRNHRKLVVCDGAVAFVGGYNLGDEYLGDGQQRTFWRDTHIKISGPAALSFQVSFVEDWHWAMHNIPELAWPEPIEQGDEKVMCIPTGPADNTASASLYFAHILHQAKHRCWMVSPYFVPDQNLVNGLVLAALRGIDVRVLVPKRSDKWLVEFASRNYIQHLQQRGVQFFSYQKGFLHQKVVLIDNEYTSIGSSNLDNRSLHINFELNALIKSRELNQQVETMLKQDFQNSLPTHISTHWWPTFITKCVRLMSPLL